MAMRYKRPLLFILSMSALFYCKVVLYPSDSVISNHISVTEVPRKNVSARSQRNLDVSLRKGYTIIANYIMADQSADIELVTYATQATVPFLRPHVTALCQRWNGPISLSVFAPSSELQSAVREINNLRMCDESVKEKITWHLITVNNTYDAIVEQLYKVEDYPVECADGKVHESGNWTYPINVARNVAMDGVRTTFVLAADIELVPSVGLCEQFTDFIMQHEELRADNNAFLLPTFEVPANCSVPETKSELVQNFKSRKAVFFHSRLWKFWDKEAKMLSSPAFHFDNQQLWIKNSTSNPDLCVFGVQKNGNNHFHNSILPEWEPFFIASSNTLPRFDEAMSWEGKFNKLSQSLEMCLMDYNYLVLDNAFLVHSPGIKWHPRFSPRKDYSLNRKALLKEIVRLERLYGRTCNRKKINV
ncbi:Beta-1,4-glucuronyltransferase 1 [Halotydeus destructor]|nr:Beta-1,4-glucuronyltransferase 1 [Halotydeus destructor]